MLNRIYLYQMLPQQSVGGQRRRDAEVPERFRET